MLSDTVARGRGPFTLLRFAQCVAFLVAAIMLPEAIGHPDFGRMAVNQSPIRTSSISLGPVPTNSKLLGTLVLQRLE